VTIEGAGGPITFHPFEVTHGSIDALGFRIGDLAYLPDVSTSPKPRGRCSRTRLLGARRAAPHAASQPRAS
jgi:phosphoribosyl 1,2-cyclic phosphate phosphodiesterase